MRNLFWGGKGVVLAVALLNPFAMSNGWAVDKVLNTDDVNVSAPEIVEDLGITKDKATSSIQSATQKDFQQSHVTNIAEFLGSSGQSVNVNEFQGNAFQIDVNYRGFTASPLLGTPQGLSVYLDGARINEPFGDVVNWDLIPMSAIASMDLISGSNPAFGLNTLGGAISLRTRDGFNDPGFKLETSAGSWGRNTYQAAMGGNNGVLGGFFTYNAINEDGWRDFAPSKLKQAFGRVDLKTDQLELSGSLLYGDNDLTGNGLTPKNLLDQKWSSIFTSPDSTANQLMHFNISGKYFLSDESDISATTYRRFNQRQTINGDLNDTNSFTQTDFDLGNANFAGSSANWLLAAQNDLWGNGQNTCTSSPLTGGPLVCDINGDGNYTDLGYAPIALIHRSYTEQVARGWSLKYNWNTERHDLMVGSSYDSSSMSFKETMQFATVNDQHQVVPLNLSALGNINGNFIENGQFQRTINTLGGHSKSFGAFMSHVWSPTKVFSLTTALRYNTTHVETNMTHADLRFDLNQQPALNPDLVLSSDNQIFRALLPAIGFTWNALPETQVYGGFTKGMRAPSPIELGCAKITDSYRAQQTAGFTQAQLQEWDRQHEVNCSVQTILTNDPPLKAVYSDSFELGLRGNLGRHLRWNTAVYRTNLHDDILFDLDAVSFHTHFFNAEKTRREGLELGLGGDYGKFKFQSSYSLTSATYQSPFKMGNHANSSCVGSPSNCTFEVKPGDRMPSVPLHMLKLTLGLDITPTLSVSLATTAQSYVFLRGNENNSYQQISGVGNNDYLDKGIANGYSVSNLNINWKLHRDWTLFAKVINVFDRKYYTAGQLRQDPYSPDLGGSFVASSGWNYNSSQWVNVANMAPGAPRAMWVGLSYEVGGKDTQAPSSTD